MYVNFSELAGVREHDLEVTDQARAAEENVSVIAFFYCVWILCLKMHFD